jgi:hypothetical protein
MTTKKEFKENLAKQLEMNKTTIARLREVGLQNDSDVELDFCYVAPNEITGHKLADSLKRMSNWKIETGYSDGSFIIQGTTGKFQFSNDAINQWVKEMCERGQEHQCVFDGWGASV